MTTVRSRSSLRAQRRAFEEGKAALLDENGALIAAGKHSPVDEAWAKDFLTWGDPPTALADKTNAPQPESAVKALLRDDETPVPEAETPRREPPYACGGLWDVEAAMPVGISACETQDEPTEEESPPPPPDEELAHEPDEEPAHEPDEVSAPPEEPPEEPPKEYPATPPRTVPKRPRRRLRRKAVHKEPVAPPQRRFLVINQPISMIRASALQSRKDKPKRVAPDPLATVTRHFARGSPVFLNTRFPPYQDRFETEYSDEFVWPRSPVRLR